MASHLGQLVSLDCAQFLSQPSNISIQPGSRQLLFGQHADQTLLSPASLFLLPDNPIITPSFFHSTINHWLETDDVFHRNFLSHVLLVRQNSQPVISELTIEAVAKGWDINIMESVQLSEICHPGPYFLQGHSLSRAFRMFPDDVGAFMFPIISSPDDPKVYVLAPIFYRGPRDG